MAERLVHLHIVEEGVTGSDALFEVTLLVEDGEAHRLGRDHPAAWQRVMGRAHRLIRAHVRERQARDN